MFLLTVQRFEICAFISDLALINCSRFISHWILNIFADVWHAHAGGTTFHRPTKQPTYIALDFFFIFFLFYFALFLFSCSLGTSEKKKKQKKVIQLLEWSTVLENGGVDLVVANCLFTAVFGIQGVDGADHRIDRIRLIHELQYRSVGRHLDDVHHVGAALEGAVKTHVAAAAR